MTDLAIPLDRRRMLADLADLVAIPSIGGTPAERQIQQHLASAWHTEGLVVHEWDVDLTNGGPVVAAPGFPGMEVPRTRAHGVLGTWPGAGDGPTLLINAHTDVVPAGDLDAWQQDPFTARVIEGPQGPAIAGRGTCDMKGGLVSAWAAIRALREAGVALRGDVVIAPVSGEEDGGVGTFALVDELARRGIAPQACVIPEPTDLDIVPANGGALTFRIRVRGHAAHASRRTEGVSAITAFLPVLAGLADLEAQRNRTVDALMHRWPIAYPLSIGTIHAGDWASTVPDLLVAEGRYGIALGEDPAEARRVLEDAIGQICADDPWLREHPVEVQWWGGQFASGSTPLDDPLIGALRDAHCADGAPAPSIYGAPYGSDLRLLAPHMPTVQYGPGDSALAHSPDESVPIAQLEQCARALAHLMIDVCGRFW